MAAKFISFTQQGARIAYRYADVEQVEQAGPEDVDQRIIVTVAGTPVRVDETFDAVLDVLNK